MLRLFTLYPTHCREHRVKTFPSPFLAEFWRHCVLTGGTQRRPTCLDIRAKKQKYAFKLIFHFVEGGSNPHQSRLQSHSRSYSLCPCATTVLKELISVPCISFLYVLTQTDVGEPINETIYIINWIVWKLFEFVLIISFNVLGINY